MTEPTDAELWQLHMQLPGQHKDPIDFALAVLAKWGAPAQAAAPVAWLDPWTGAKVTTDYDAYGKHGIPLVRQQPVAREPLTPEQIQDLLLCGDPTDEEMRLIRIGWDAAHGIKGGQHGTE